jgi:hypothetical protein
MNGAPPFFIVGFQRSGTTLLRVMLDAHPRVAIPLDTVGLWDRYERKLPDYELLQTETGRQRIIEDLLEEERITLWKAPFRREQIQQRWSDHSFPGLIDAIYREFAAQRGKERWGDKDPGNMVRIDQLNRWFPASLFIHIVRDGRDACLSQMQQDFGSNNLLDCACAWREEVQWVRRMGRLLGPERYIETRYEDLILDTEAELRRICRFLGLDYDPAMLAYYTHAGETVPDEKRHIWPLIDQPPVRDNSGKWRRQLSRGQRICFEKRAGEVLGELGYDILPQASGGYFEEIRNFGASALKAVARRLRRR